MITDDLIAGSLRHCFIAVFDKPRVKIGGHECVEPVENRHDGAFDFGTIDTSSAQAVCEQIIEINVTAQIAPIQMIVNSPGGSCTDGFTVIDMMEWLRIPIYTAGIGMIASMGLLIFMAGERGRHKQVPVL